MFLTGTILNVITVLLGTGLGLLIGSRMPSRMHPDHHRHRRHHPARGRTPPARPQGGAIGQFLPALLLAPVFMRLADVVRDWLA